MSSEEAARILGVSVDAKTAELNKAWRQIARTCHPDLHPGDKEAEERFRLLNRAFTTLSEIHEGARRMRGLEEDIFNDIFDDVLSAVGPKRRKQIERELRELEKEDDA